MQFLSHFSSKASPSLLPSLTTALNIRRRPPKFHFYPSNPSKFPRPPTLACNLSSGYSQQASMDSPPTPETPASVDSVTRDLRNQTLTGDDHEGINGVNNAPRARLKLEDLNWDNSFVRELPGDPRTDTFPREVSSFLFYVIRFCLDAEKFEKSMQGKESLSVMFSMCLCTS